MMDGIDDLRLSSRNRFVYCPFEPVTAHTFITLEPYDLSKLAHPDVLDLGI